MLDFHLMLTEARRPILVTGLNPCLDVSLTVRDFDVGQTNYYTLYQEDLGGKGSNVIRSIHAYGGSGKLFSADYPDDGSKVMHLMQREGIAAELVNLPGHLRINYKILDNGEQGEVRMTELNSPGNYLPEVAVRLLEREWMRQIEEDQLLVLCGSLAPGLPDDTYKQMIEAQHARGGRVVLDAKNEALIHALGAKPDIVKPNRDELSQATDMPCQTLEEVVAAVDRLRELGAGLVLASLAEDGAILTQGEAVYYAPAPTNPSIRRLSGAGDAMVAILAGFASGDAALRDEELPGVLRWSMAASQATISRDEARMPGIEEIAVWTERIEVRRIR